MSDEANEFVKTYGKTVERVEVQTSHHGDVNGFTMYFTDGTVLDVSSKGHYDCSSSISVDVD
jgi:hypothetical protein